MVWQDRENATIFKASALTMNNKADILLCRQFTHRFKNLTTVFTALVSKARHLSSRSEIVPSPEDNVSLGTNDPAEVKYQCRQNSDKLHKLFIMVGKLQKNSMK